MYGYSSDFNNTLKDEDIHCRVIIPRIRVQDIDEEEYNNLLNDMPESIDWSKLKDFEKEDTTTGSKDLACVAGSCEIVDIEGR